MSEQCQCNYCQFQVTEEDFEKMSEEFLYGVVECFLKQSKGIRLTDDNIETIQGVGGFCEEILAGPNENEILEQIRITWINALASCYEQPVYFYDAICGLQQLIPCVKHALAADPTSASTPILTKIITPEIFLGYFLKREFPEDVNMLIDKIAQAEFVTSTKQ